jgi:probable HAF family extracellular repeat protein
MLKMRHAMTVLTLALAASVSSGSARYQDAGYTIIDLGPLGGGGSAEGINSIGEVAGYSYKIGDPVVYATRWDSAGVHDLLTLGGRDSEAYAINASGQVVGFSYIAGNQVHRATLWDSSGPHDLGTIGGSKAIAYAINRLGQVVGSSDISGDAFHRATLWTLLVPGTLAHSADLTALHTASMTPGPSLDTPG